MQNTRRQKNILRRWQKWVRLVSIPRTFKWRANHANGLLAQKNRATWKWLWWNEYEENENLLLLSFFALLLFLLEYFVGQGKNRYTISLLCIISNCFQHKFFSFEPFAKLKKKLSSQFIFLSTIVGYLTSKVMFLFNFRHVTLHYKLLKKRPERNKMFVNSRCFDQKY